MQQLSRRSFIAGASALWSASFVRSSHATHPWCADPKEGRLGYKGFMHCELHEHYQKAFKDWNCHCYSGQCRPTKFRYASPGELVHVDAALFRTDMLIYVSGEWFPIPVAAYRTERAYMSDALLQWNAHVCSSEPPYPHIECAWINLIG